MSTDPDAHALVVDLAQHAGDHGACLDLLADYRDDHGLAQALLVFELALAQTFGAHMSRTDNTGAPVPVTIEREKD
ncbi:hypothetical protein AB4028_00325 [Janibacter sp. RAF20_2_2]|uniref:hypothetical protein n=1 Tax=unclassified Janibacter TaxID=2649294 RepID=UPI003F906693